MEIQRDEEKCNECMMCVSECVSGVIRNVDGAPVVVDPLSCNLCSHCAAICPKNAIIHDSLDLTQVRRLKRKPSAPDVFEEVVRGRRSIRHYREEPVAREDLERILDLARYSPTASNTQHVEYVVITDREIIRELSGRIFSMGKKIHSWARSFAGEAVLGAMEAANIPLSIGRYLDRIDYYNELSQEGRDFILHNAPVLILVCAPSRASFACDDCNIAAANITNYAHALGLGTCYIGFLTLALRFSKKLREIAGVPEGKKAFVSLVMGRPKYAFKSTTSRKPPQIKWIG